MRKRSARKTPWRILRTKVWETDLSTLIEASDKQFEMSYPVEKHEKTNQMPRWRKGVVTVQESTVLRINDIYKGSKRCFEYDLFELFSDTRSGKTYLKKYLEKNAPSLDSFSEFEWFYDKDYEIFMNIPQIDGGFGWPLTWYFDNEIRMEIDPDNLIPTPSRFDSHNLLDRGDLDGFTGILALVREAEYKNDTAQHALHLANLYRALPAVARMDEFKPHWKELGQLIMGIHLKVPQSHQHISPRWDIIEKQVVAREHITPWYQRLTHPNPITASDVEDCVAIDMEKASISKLHPEKLNALLLP